MRFNNPRGRIAALLFGLCVAPITTVIGADEQKLQLLERWREIENREQVEQKSYVVDFVLSIGILDKDGPKMVRKSRTYYVQRKEGYNHVRIEEPGSPSTVFARSPRYAFVLNKGRSSSESQVDWAISKYYDESTAAEVRIMEFKIAGSQGVGVLHPLSSSSSDEIATQMFGHPGVSIQPGVPLLNGLASAEYSRPKWVGTIVTDPHHSHVIMSCNSSIEGSNNSSLRNNFTRHIASEDPEIVDRLRQCKQITSINWDTKDNKERINLRLDFRDYSYGEIPEEIFYLSHYGLPEPIGKGSMPSSVPRYVWFLAAAGVFVTLAVGFRFLARRRQAVHPA